jgi:hypothetical protein
MLKKIFIILVVLLLIVLIFFGIYMVAFNDGIKQNNPDEYNEQEDIQLAGVSEKMTNITSEPIIAATVTQDGENIIFYNALDGNVWTMTLKGVNKKSLKEENSEVPIDVKWATGGEAAIVKYGNGQIFVKQYTNDIEHKLRDGMDDVVWSGAGNRILYKYYDVNSGERTLNISNVDGSNWKKIADLPFRFATFTQVPSSIFAAFWPTEYAFEETQLFTTSTINESTPTKIFVGKYGADFKYSPTGENILVSSVYEDGHKLTLGIIDNKGENYNDFLVPTLTQKTVWTKDGKTIFYAQPVDVPEGTIWPNDYNAKKFTTKDTFYKMDIDSGKKERIIELEDITEGVDAVDLFLSPTEDALFFTNRVNGLLYRINI